MNFHHALLRGNTWRRAASVKVQQANVCALPFVKETFELVICAHVLEHLADPKIGLCELVRVLRPAAPLVLVVTRPGLLDGLMRWRWNYRAIRMAQLLKWLDEVGVTRSIPWPGRGIKVYHSADYPRSLSSALITSVPS